VDGQRASGETAAGWAAKLSSVTEDYDLKDIALTSRTLRFKSKRYMSVQYSRVMFNSFPVRFYELRNVY
jgi:hypothetical protein